MLASLMLPLLCFAADLPADYEVPVPAELKAYSRYAMEPVNVGQEGGEIRVRYTLPRALTGAENEVEMFGIRGKNGVLELSGKNGSARCVREGANESCAVKYLKVRFDLDRVREELEKMGLSPEEKAGYLKVSTHLAQGGREHAFASLMAASGGSDMQGIIHYQGRLPDSY